MMSTKCKNGGWLLRLVLVTLALSLQAGSTENVEGVVQMQVSLEDSLEDAGIPASAMPDALIDEDSDAVMGQGVTPGMVEEGKKNGDVLTESQDGHNRGDVESQQSNGESQASSNGGDVGVKDINRDDAIIPVSSMTGANRDENEDDLMGQGVTADVDVVAM